MMNWHKVHVMQWINSEEMFVKSVGYFYVPFNIMMKKNNK